MWQLEQRKNDGVYVIGSLLLSTPRHDMAAGSETGVFEEAQTT